MESFTLHHKHQHNQNLTIEPTMPFFHRRPAINMPDIRSSTAAVLVPVRNVVSSSWLYPFKGIWYFCAHREFWPLWGRRLVPLTVTSIVILVLLFTFTYLPQVAFLALFHGPGAWVNAMILVLGEGQVVIALLFEAMLVDETLVNVFDVCPIMPPMFLCPTTLSDASMNGPKLTIVRSRQHLFAKVSSTLFLPLESSSTMPQIQ
jgi:hypothetical protein